VHFWVGSFCHIEDRGNVFFPPRVISISDIITLDADLGNKIPDKSWMLYLLELFNRQNVSLELNLICSFNDDGKFHAIFGGMNQHEFTMIRPEVDHSYMRQIIMNSATKSITYILKDITVNKSEKFDFTMEDRSFIFEGANHFTGIEWWNKSGNFPYPIRFHVEISQLLFGQGDDPSDPQSISYYPYNRLIPDGDGRVKEYPVSFSKPEIRDGCLCYRIIS
jgi:hypothetical protein